MRVGLPGLTVLLSLTVVLAVACVAAPIIAACGRRRGAQLAVLIPAGLLVVAAVLVGAVVPALVQRYAVDPSPLLPRSPTGQLDPAPRPGSGSTRSTSGLRARGPFTAADFADSRPARRVPIWDPPPRRPDASGRHGAAVLQSQDP